MKSIDVKKLINGFPTIKKVVYHSFLTILLGVTISVCSSVKEEKSDDSTAVASSGVDITDGSDQGYMRIGNMQIVWGSASLSNSGTAVTFPKSFSNVPKVIIQGIHSNGTSQDVTSVTTTSAILSHGWTSGDSFPYDYLAIGKWQ